MNDYDFSTLNDKEFEILASDLLSAELNCKIDRFKPGPDQGVDGRYFTNGSEIILQYKHYYGSGYQKLIYDLENKELIKVKKLNPKRYIFATSLPLSRANKSKIKQIFSPFIKSQDDIFGKENLNDILKEKPQIEKRHYKLWLSSVSVLQTIFNNAIHGRSKSFLEEIKENIKLYVQTENHDKAIKILNESNVIIITGEPGIGKTTLAESLCLFYCSHGYELCVIENSLNEAESAYLSEDKPDKKIFYFDDFLGSNYLQALQPHDDTHITGFIQRIKRDENKKFILTSRTNIFNRGLSLSDTFKNKKIKNAEFILSVDALSNLDKGKILYNHLWLKGLYGENIDQIYLNKRYMKIIKHPNYNPRIIEYITDNDRLKHIVNSAYWEYVSNTLDNPSEIWATPFYVQSDDFIRNLVLLTVFNENRIEESILMQSYVKLNRIDQLSNNSNLSNAFEIVIKSAVGFFLNRSILSDETIIYTPFNPSVSDFIVKSYKNNIEKLTYVYQALKTTNALKSLHDLCKNEEVTKENFKTILSAIFERSDFKDTIHSRYYDYFTTLIHFLFEDKYLEKKYRHKATIIINKILLKPKGLNALSKFTEILIFLCIKECIEQVEQIKLFKLIDCNRFSLDDLKAVMKIIDFFEITDEEKLEEIRELTHDYLVDSLYDECRDIELSEYFEGGDEYGPSVNEDAVDSVIDDVFQTLLMGLEISPSLNIDEYGIRLDIDISQLVDDYISKMGDGHYDDEGGRGHSSFSTDSIEDLFDRSGL